MIPPDDIQLQFVSTRTKTLEEIYDCIISIKNRVHRISSVGRSFFITDNTQLC